MMHASGGGASRVQAGPDRVRQPILSSEQHHVRDGRRVGIPTQAVVEALLLSVSAAAKRVRRARDAGLLPETTRGRAMAGDPQAEG
jgi:hypothetical protein